MDRLIQIIGCVVAVYSAGLGGAAVAAIPSEPARGYRVENRVYLGDEEQAQTSSTTIFCEGVVYDFLEKPAEVTIFDAARERFILLDPARRVRAEIATTQLEEICRELQAWAAQQDDELLQFLAQPQFTEAFDESTGQLTLAAEPLTYIVTSEPASREMADGCRLFADWYGRLNARLNPGSRPPFARFVVNERLSSHCRIPREVKLIAGRVKAPLSRETTVARSEHQWVRILSASDRRRLAEAGEWMAVFKPVAIAEYQAGMRRAVSEPEEGGE